MKLVTTILTYATVPILAFIIPYTILNANVIRDFMKEKCSIQEAIAALHKGHCVYRAGERKKYCVKKEIFDGKEKVFIGNTWGDDKFSEGVIFRTEDIMNNDWIIEPLQEKMEVKETK